MGSVKDLPVEILCDIFSHLKRQTVGVKSSDDIKIIKLASQDVFECQLVCKQWMRPAQQIIYKEIFIKGLRSLMHFAQLMKNLDDAPPSLLTETILINPENDVVFLATLFTVLSLICPNVKKIHSVQIPSNYFWSVLMRERYEGNLQLLEEVPPVNATTLACVLHYELAAWSLNETLTHLEVFDWLPIPGKNLTRLSAFENLKSLKLNLEDFRSIYGLDQLMHNGLKSIDIDVEAREGTTLPNPDKPVNLANVMALPNVKYLNAKGMVTNDTVVSYLMCMLPELKDLVIFFSSLAHLELSEVGRPRFRPLSTKVGIQFLEYLNKIPNIYIDNICVQDPLGIMAGFFGRSLDTLEFEYDIYPQEEENLDNSYVRFTAGKDHSSSVIRRGDLEEWIPIIPFNDKTRFKTAVTFEVQENTEALPHMEMVEYFGQDLKTLSLDFGEDSADDKRNDDPESASNGQYFSHVLQHCPKLQNLHLSFTNLEKCEFYIPSGNTFLVGGDLSFKVAVIHSDVLRHLTIFLPKLNKLTLSSCTVHNDHDHAEEPGMIKMKSTSVSELCWTSDDQVYSRPFDALFLKLVINGTKTYYYEGNKSKFVKCTDWDYEATGRGEDCLSLYLEFKKLDCIAIDTFDFHMKICACKGGYRLEEIYPISFTRPQKPLFEDSDIDFDSDTS